LAFSTVPPPAELRVGEVGWLKPWLQERTWISLAWLLAVASPSIPGSSNLMKMFWDMLTS